MLTPSASGSHIEGSCSGMLEDVNDECEPRLLGHEVDEFVWVSISSAVPESVFILYDILREGK